MSTSLITAYFRGHMVTRDAVLHWEDRRITAAARALHVRPPAGADVATRREELLHTKLNLGPEEIAARLNRQTRISNVVARTGTKLSRRRRISAIELNARDGCADQFVTAFRGSTESSNEAAMLRACPDHFVIRTNTAGGQEVLETTGGSPLPSFFVVDYGDISSLTTPPDPQFPLQVAGVARSSSGIAIGGVRHQFRDAPGGFVARLTVEFPLPTLGRMIAGHRWHLACEFSNWIEAALR